MLLCNLRFNIVNALNVKSKPDAVHLSSMRYDAGIYLKLFYICGVIPHVRGV